MDFDGEPVLRVHSIFGGTVGREEVCPLVSSPHSLLRFGSMFPDNTDDQEAFIPGVSNLQPMGCTWPKMALNAAQHKMVNLLKNFFCSSVFISVCVFNVWSKATLLPVWPRDAKR